MVFTNFLKKKYKITTNRNLCLSNPISLNEKFQWYKINYRTPLMTICADKYAVREYVTECGLGHLLNEQYGVYDSFEEIDFSKLPEEVYIKCNHTSGINALVHKHNLDVYTKKELNEYFNKGLRHNYYWETREWAYKNIKPKLICEKFLVSKNDNPLIDLNFFCFSGKVHLIYYNVGLADDKGRHSEGNRAILDEDFRYIKGAYTKMKIIDEKDVHLPNNMEQLKEYAERLSRPFPHARVDFFVINGSVYFGEITFYSASGFMFLKPNELYDKLGKVFDLDYCC